MKVVPGLVARRFLAALIGRVFGVTGIGCNNEHTTCTLTLVLGGSRWRVTVRNRSNRVTLEADHGFMVDLFPDTSPKWIGKEPKTWAGAFPEWVLREWKEAEKILEDEEGE